MTMKNSNRNRTLRLFIALPAEAAARALASVHAHLSRYSRDLKVVLPEHYHITLAFLGSVPYGQAMSLAEDFSRIRPAPCLPFAMKGLGAFPSTSRPRVIWCGIECDYDAVRRLARMAEEAAAPYGYTPEKRPFQPHLTIARVRDDHRPSTEISAYLASQSDAHYGESVFSQMVLFRSELGRDGPRYTPLATVLLR